MNIKLVGHYTVTQLNGLQNFHSVNNLRINLYWRLGLEFSVVRFQGLLNVRVFKWLDPCHWPPQKTVPRTPVAGDIHKLEQAGANVYNGTNFFAERSICKSRNLFFFY